MLQTLYSDVRLGWMKSTVLGNPPTKQIRSSQILYQKLHNFDLDSKHNVEINRKKRRDTSHAFYKLSICTILMYGLKVAVQFSFTVQKLIFM